MDDEIDRIKRESESASLKYEMERKMSILGELRPDAINWDNMSDDMIERHIVMAMKHECYRYVKLLESKKHERWAESIRKHIKGDRDDI